MASVAVVGGGIQGCLIALAASHRGHEVTLFEQTGSIMNRASLWNEGKLHLGYIYGADKSLRTAEAMIDGSFSFVGEVERLTGRTIPETAFSRPFTYLVDRNSLEDPEDLAKYYAACDDLIDSMLTSGRGSYPGLHRGDRVRRLAQGDIESIAGDWCVGAFQTPEVSVDPHVVAGMVVAAIDEADVAVELGARIDSVGGGPGRWHLNLAGVGAGPFDHVVNAAWEDRLRIDQTAGMHVNRDVTMRYKVAIHHVGPASNQLPSVSIVLGPYGDVVSFGDRAYISWYPAGRLGLSRDVNPPDFAAMLTETRRRAVLADTVEALGDRLASVRAAAGQLLNREASRIEGGYIVAWGGSDVDDAASELHERFDIGGAEEGSYHSVDTGKYCTAPSFARDVGDRLAQA